MYNYLVGCSNALVCIRDVRKFHQSFDGPAGCRVANEFVSESNYFGLSGEELIRDILLARLQLPLQLRVDHLFIALTILISLKGLNSL